MELLDFLRARLDEDGQGAREALRALIELHKARDDWTIGPDDREYLAGQACVVDDDPYPCQTLEILASAHSDHSDYDEAWKP